MSENVTAVAEAPKAEVATAVAPERWLSNFSFQEIQGKPDATNGFTRKKIGSHYYLFWRIEYGNYDEVVKSIAVSVNVAERIMPDWTSANARAMTLPAALEVGVMKGQTRQELENVDAASALTEWKSFPITPRNPGFTVQSFPAMTPCARLVMRAPVEWYVYRGTTNATACQSPTPVEPPIREIDYPMAPPRPSTFRFVADTFEFEGHRWIGAFAHPKRQPTDAMPLLVIHARNPGVTHEAGVASYSSLDFAYWWLRMWADAHDAYVMVVPSMDYSYRWDIDIYREDPMVMTSRGSVTYGQPAHTWFMRATEVRIQGLLMDPSLMIDPSKVIVCDPSMTGAGFGLEMAVQNPSLVSKVVGVQPQTWALTQGRLTWAIFNEDYTVRPAAHPNATGPWYSEWTRMMLELRQMPIQMATTRFLTALPSRFQGDYNQGLGMHHWLLGQGKDSKIMYWDPAGAGQYVMTGNDLPTLSLPDTYTRNVSWLTYWQNKQFVDEIFA